MAAYLDSLRANWYDVQANLFRDTHPREQTNLILEVI